MNSGVFQIAAGSDPFGFAALEAQIFQDPWPASAFVSDEGRLAFSLREGDHCRAYVFGSCVLDEAELLRIATAPEARGRGFARRLLHEFMSACFERGVTQIFLEVDEDNAPAISLYLAAGFQACGRRPHYYGPNRAALLMKFSRLDP